MRIPRVIGGLAAACLALILTYGGAELLFRLFLFSGLPSAQRFRRPELYASYLNDDDYWKLDHLFGRSKFRRGKSSHQVLGWVGSFDAESYVHQDAALVDGRRPVLLYGDSFAACATRECFQHFFNQDRDLSRACYLLNYGVGAYGVDQSYLLLTKSLGVYHDPAIVFSLLTEDLDRAVHRVFVAQKPLLVERQGELVLDDVSIDPDPEAYFQSHPVDVFYLYRLLLHHPRTPRVLSDYLTDQSALTARKISLARSILRETIGLLRARAGWFEFLVFVGPGEASGGDDWRLATIVDLLNEERVPYISTRDLLRRDMQQSGLPEEAYFIPGDGHPNDRQNHVVYAALKETLPFCRE